MTVHLLTFWSIYDPAAVAFKGPSIHMCSTRLSYELYLHDFHFRNTHYNYTLWVKFRISMFFSNFLKNLSNGSRVITVEDGYKKHVNLPLLLILRTTYGKWGGFVNGQLLTSFCLISCTSEQTSHDMHMDERARSSYWFNAIGNIAV
jgi:hypothetical protein